MTPTIPTFFDAYGPFLLILAVIIPLGLFLAHQEKQRREAIKTLCQSLGLRVILGHDLHLPQKYGAISLFQKGRRRRAENVIRGSYKNVPIQAFEYQYETQSTDSDGKTKTHHHRFFCTALQLPKHFPQIRLRPEHMFDKVLAAVGFDDIDFESYQFSKAFHVSSNDKRFAYDFFHPQMQEHCLSRPDFNLELTGNDLVIYWRGRLQPEQLTHHLDLLVGMSNLFPKHLLKH